ncbi:MAG: hypothetical protein IKD18_02680 [Clostridia bacterium]|nr:hypothetical protein [Clostridia bacterium]
MEIKNLLKLFPPRIKKALCAFDEWKGISEIRLRRSLPLSLTHFRGNILLDETGRITTAERALRTDEAEIRAFIGAFCGGSVYRFFDTMKDGFLVNEDGIRLGICPSRGSFQSLLPERIEGINLRLPREVKGAAKPLINYFENGPLGSTLILSPPGAGKTTLLRDLACALSKGFKGQAPLRVAVIDERCEIFPSVFLPSGGLCDVIRGYPKAEGIEIATRLFSPEAIMCDEIGGSDEAERILSTGGAGCMLFATAHAANFEDAKRRPVLKKLLDAHIFRYTAILERIPGETYQSSIRMEVMP